MVLRPTRRTLCVCKDLSDWVRFSNSSSSVCVQPSKLTMSQQGKLSPNLDLGWVWFGCLPFNLSFVTGWNENESVIDSVYVSNDWKITNGSEGRTEWVTFKSQRISPSQSQLSQLANFSERESEFWVSESGVINFEKFAVSLMETFLRMNETDMYDGLELDNGPFFDNSSFGNSTVVGATSWGTIVLMCLASIFLAFIILSTIIGK